MIEGSESEVELKPETDTDSSTSKFLKLASASASNSIWASTPLDNSRLWGPSFGFSSGSLIFRKVNNLH